MSNLLDQIEEAAEEATTGEVDANAIAEVVRLAQRQFDAQREIEGLKARIDELREEIEQLSRNQVPEAMQTANLTSFTLANGAAVELKPDLFISIPATKKADALDWLEANGHEDIVKFVVEAAFKAGQMDQAKTLADALDADGFNSKVKRDVHAQTLRKWARKETEQGRQPPEDLFRCFDFIEAKITPKG
jgi:hypothetical protein